MYCVYSVYNYKGDFTQNVYDFTHTCCSWIPYKHGYFAVNVRLLELLNATNRTIEYTCAWWVCIAVYCHL